MAVKFHKLDENPYLNTLIQTVAILISVAHS